MKYDAKFWYSMVVFQFFFGLAVFAFTRDYYRVEVASTPPQPITNQQRNADWAADGGVAEVVSPGSQTSAGLAAEDPVAMSRLADKYFADKQYAQAAVIYEQLLAYSSNGAEIHNNLGLTLHYLGRSDEALGILEEGVAIDPDNQRIWLTIGYVSRELGNTAQAREALMNAIEGGTDVSIRQSAQQMLDTLP